MGKPNYITPKPGYQWNPLKKFPRNTLCPCGSKKKFKRCHIDLIAPAVTNAQAKKLKAVLVMAEKGYPIDISESSNDEQQKTN